MMKSAILALADGTIFNGIALGCEGETVGEVVFNTSMTGYQEILTDPSYAGQIITFSSPHIGNVGCNSEDNESEKIWAKGVIIRDVSLAWSNWRGELSLEEFLKKQEIIGISQIDTRRLIHILRESGAQSGCISTCSSPDEAVAKARALPKMEGQDLAKVVSTQTIYEWKRSSGSWSMQAGQQSGRLKGERYNKPEVFQAATRRSEIERAECTQQYMSTRDDLQQSGRLKDEGLHIAAYDYGVKSHILEIFSDLGCRVTVFPAATPAKEVLAYEPDGVFLSNGPGDPEVCDYAISAIKVFLEKNIPLFGICLGFQLLALACGAKTHKMKFGHHGANHPIACIEDENRVMITSQNHGFAVDEKTLPPDLKVTHRSLFDNSLQGIRHQHKPAFGVQGHPEASPGPHDAYGLFGKFIALIQR